MKAKRVVKKGGKWPPITKALQKTPIPKPARPAPAASAAKTVEQQHGELTK